MIWPVTAEIKISPRNWATTQTLHKNQHSLGDYLASLAADVLSGRARNIEIRQLEDADYDTGEVSDKVLQFTVIH